MFSEGSIGAIMNVNYSADISSASSSNIGSPPDYTERLKVLYKTDERVLHNNANGNAGNDQ